MYAQEGLLDAVGVFPSVGTSCIRSAACETGAIGVTELPLML